jgi:shikimate dehydrogenase
LSSGLYHLGIIGWPLEYSLSPMIHHAALKKLGLSGDYRCFPIKPLPKGAEALRKLLDQVRKGELQGLNVTVPHKETILGELDHLTSVAERIGAVNTIFMQGTALVGDNTDQEGFLTDLETALAPVLGSALVLGAGGAARAVVDGLSGGGWKVWVAARRIDQAEGIAQSLYQAGRPAILPIKLDPDIIRSVMAEVRLIVNATPLGMMPNVNISPWPEELSFPDEAVVYDLIYTPQETRLTREARNSGLQAVTGMGMLIEQAALAFECWTGHEAPREAMRQAVEG